MKADAFFDFLFRGTSTGNAELLSAGHWMIRPCGVLIFRYPSFKSLAPPEFKSTQ
ncbi:hypothetical protein M378DRAFT_161917 [Amanita muscaria Koide BX008]|uniref:Uncharacterized protein n=1 Tax=Amanita muscaria (strain Koide BX008) TaxID=946122 RepID=A0A0C2WV32_AMAMK|nr:hypothetical protein M378DRAFT_161917 [Amanita muscaria Koide BX008]